VGFVGLIPISDQNVITRNTGLRLRDDLKGLNMVFRPCSVPFEGMGGGVVIMLTHFQYQIYYTNNGGTQQRTKTEESENKVLRRTYY
jgi:hypothetical protein